MNSLHRVPLFILYVLLLMACRPQASAQTGAAVSPADWPSYNHDPSGWRFNPAEKTLGPGNVGKLVEKWRFPAADSKETVDLLLRDLPELRARTPSVDVDALLAARAVKVVTFADYQRIDAAEKARGTARGKVRDKLERIPDMLAAAFAKA